MSDIVEFINETVAKNASKSLDEITDGFTSYPMYWNDAICFTKNQFMAIPGIALGIEV